MTGIHGVLWILSPKYTSNQSTCFHLHCRHPSPDGHPLPPGPLPQAQYLMPSFHAHSHSPSTVLPMLSSKMMSRIMLHLIWDLSIASNHSESKISKRLPQPLRPKVICLLPAPAVLSIPPHSSHTGLDPQVLSCHRTFAFLVPYLECSSSGFCP